MEDFPGGPMVKNPPTNAGGFRKILHAAGQPSPIAATNDSTRPGAYVLQLQKALQ